MIGDNIIDTLTSLKSKGFQVDYKKTEEGFNYFVKGKNYRLETIINAPKWIGLEFSLVDNKNKTQITYDINSDLYDLSLSKYSEFAEDIEMEIVNFLESLANKEIKAGTIKDKQAIYFPKDNKFLLVKKGWFFTSNVEYKDKESIEKLGEFHLI